MHYIVSTQLHVWANMDKYKEVNINEIPWNINIFPGAVASKCIQHGERIEYHKDRYQASVATEEKQTRCLTGSFNEWRSGALVSYRYISICLYMYFMYT